MQVIAQSRAFINYKIMSYYKPQINFQVLVNGKRVSSHTTFNAAMKRAKTYGQTLFGNMRAEIVDVNTGAITAI